MGEIKSTLDLVMEKTKHLSLSEAEKVGQQRDTYEQQLKGLLQKFADGLLPIERFQNQLKTMQEQLNVNDEELLIRQILIHIQPDEDNGLWLELVDLYMPKLRAPIQESLTTYAQHRETLLQASRQQYLDNLKSDRQIQGSSVVPNIVLDRAVQEKLTTLQQEFLAFIDTLQQQP